MEVLIILSSQAAEKRERFAERRNSFLRKKEGQCSGKSLFSLQEQ